MKALEREVRELRQANEILRKVSAYFCPGGARPPVPAMIAFIDDHRATYGVEPICRVLPIARSTYFERVAQRRDLMRLSARAQRDQALKPEIARVYAENFGVYGVRKVWRQMMREGFYGRPLHHRAIDARDGLGRRDPRQAGAHHRQRQGGAVPARPRQTASFRAPAPNRLWVSDFTYVATWAGFVYVAFVIDTYVPPHRRLASQQDGACQLRAGLRSSRRYTIAGRFIVAAWFTIAIAGRSTCPSSTPSALPKRGSSHRWAASATATTTLWPRRSTASTRPR